MSKTNQKPAVLKTCTAAARAAEAHAQTSHNWADSAEDSCMLAQHAAEGAHSSAVRAAAALADMEAAHASMNRCINAAIIISGISLGLTLAALCL